MKRCLFAFLFLFACLTAGAVKLNAEESTLSAVSGEIAELEELARTIDEKKAEILLKLMADCSGYDDINAAFPLEELISPIDALVKKYGWNEKAAADVAETLWFTARPCGPKPGFRLVKTFDSIEYVFRWCPAGTFTMGCPQSEWNEDDIDWKSYDETQHEVTLTKGFWMLETEVTQAMWKSVMGTNVRQQRDEADLNWSLRGEGAEYPIYYVNWEECKDFCERLSSKLGVKVSLPTEAQWEYACRAGTTGTYTGNLDAMAWYLFNSGDKTHPVGQKKPNAWGLYDMHGNVLEWCSDWYGKNYYVESPTSDPKGPDRGSDRVLRGGCWIGDASSCRSAHRGWAEPDYRFGTFGLRIVWQPSEE